jgi:hypothetical protein
MVNRVPPAAGWVAGGANKFEAAAGAATLGGPNANEPPEGCGSPPVGAAGDAGWLPPNANEGAEGCAGAVAPNENDGADRLNVDGLDGADDVLCCPNGLLEVWPKVNGEAGATLGDAA